MQALLRGGMQDRRLWEDLASCGRLVHFHFLVRIFRFVESSTAIAVSAAGDARTRNCVRPVPALHVSPASLQAQQLNQQH